MLVHEESKECIRINVYQAELVMGIFGYFFTALMALHSRYFTSYLIYLEFVWEHLSKKISNLVLIEPGFHTIHVEFF